jgi:ABC-type antimicrobial peptide transport system permease subunit
VLRLILREGFMLAVLGSIVGVAGALSLSRFLSMLLFGVTTVDPVTFTALTLLLLVVVFAACYIPGRRASQVDPSTALRHE